MNTMNVGNLFTDTYVNGHPPTPEAWETMMATLSLGILQGIHDVNMGLLEDLIAAIGQVSAYENTLLEHMMTPAITSAYRQGQLRTLITLITAALLEPTS